MVLPKSYPGVPFPLGSNWTGEGVNFAIYSEHAKSVDLLLFEDNEREHICVNITERTGHIWHIYLAGIQPGQLYGYKVDGPFEPENGHRFNRNKLLIDPYAKAITAKVNWDDTLSGYNHDDENKDLSFNEKDSSASMPKCVVVDHTFDWEEDRAPKIPLHKTMIYELHVKGFTQLHPHIPEEIRGSYAALGAPPCH